MGFKQYCQWAVHRHLSHPEQLVEDLRGMGEAAHSMMIGGEEHIVMGIAQVIPIISNGNTTDVIVLLNVYPKHPR